jgi:hypothetical protein
MGEINDSCVKLVKLKSLSRAEIYKGVEEQNVALQQGIVL